MIKYPKIETIFKRDPDTHKIIPWDFRRIEFAMIDSWLVTEKIDGMNIRIIYYPDTHRVIFTGRTDKAIIPQPLLDYLHDVITPDKLAHVFKPESEQTSEKRAFRIILYGEGYGPKIQSGGNYAPSPRFRLFDVLIIKPTPPQRLWLNWESVEDIAEKLGIKTAPKLGIMETAEIVSLVEVGIPSQVAKEENNMLYLSEGVVARTDPLLLTRQGRRVIWKLKTKDFR